MSGTLPKAVAAYLSAASPKQIADCFTPDGVAVDERHQYVGRQSILAWREAVSKVAYHQEILSSHPSEGGITVNCRISGDFKGSPVDLSYAFRLAGDHIARLEIS